MIDPVRIFRAVSNVMDLSLKMMPFPVIFIIDCQLESFFPSCMTRENESKVGNKLTRHAGKKTKKIKNPLRDVGNPFVEVAFSYWLNLRKPIKSKERKE